MVSMFEVTQRISYAKRNAIMSVQRLFNPRNGWRLERGGPFYAPNKNDPILGRIRRVHLVQPV